MNSQRLLQHFILTRFNLLLWNKDKEGNKVRTMEWLEHRFALFENYCLPSIKNQTCQEFVWIVLFDSTTPDIFKNRIADYENNVRSYAQFMLNQLMDVILLKSFEKKW